MTRQVKEMLNMDLEKFKFALNQSYILVDNLNKYFKILTHKENWDDFITRLDVVKSINPDFVKNDNVHIWANAVIKPQLKVDTLLDLGFIPTEDSYLGSAIINRKLYYSQFWETTDEMFDQVFSLVNVHNGSQTVIKDIEKAIKDNYKAKCILENEEIVWIEKYYHQYQSNTTNLAKCRFLILQNQINYIEKILPNENLIDTYPFNEIIIPHVQYLKEHFPDALKYLKKIESKNNQFSQFITSWDAYEKLDQKIPCIESFSKDKFKI